MKLTPRECPSSSYRTCSTRDDARLKTATVMHALSEPPRRRDFLRLPCLLQADMCQRRLAGALTRGLPVRRMQQGRPVKKLQMFSTSRWRDPQVDLARSGGALAPSNLASMCRSHPCLRCTTVTPALLASKSCGSSRQRRHLAETRGSTSEVPAKYQRRTSEVHDRLLTQFDHTA